MDMPTFVKLARTEHRLILPLLQHLFTLEGKTYALGDVKKILASDIADRRDIFALKEGSTVIGCVCLALRDDDAELSHFVVGQEHAGKGYGELLLQHVLDYCMKHHVTSLSCVIPRVYELLFAQNGFFMNRDKVFMELKRQPATQQASLKDTFQDLSAVEDIVGVTAQKLRRLKTR